MSVVAREKIKGSGIWWLFINHGGKRKSKKIGTDKVEAMRLSKILEGRLAAGDLGMDDLNKKDRVQPFSFYAKQWLEVTMPGECRPGTQREHRGTYRRHIKTAPFFKKRVDSITESDIESYLASKRKKLSLSSVVHIKNALSNCFKRALKDRKIRINPCAGATIPKLGKPDRELAEPYNHEEIEQLLKAFKGHHYYTLVLFLCRTGCRAGEAAALSWGDIDFTGRKVHIHGSVRDGVVGPTKNGKDRFVDLTPSLVFALRKLKIRTPGDIVFLNTKSDRCNMSNFRCKTWYPVLDKYGLRRIRLHDLRHSFASILIQRSKDIYYTSKMLGHGDIRITCNSYGHLLETSGMTKTVDHLENLNRTPTAPEQKQESAG